LIDPHLHLLALAARRAHLDVGAHRQAAALLAALRVYAAGLPAGAWVRAEGLDDALIDRIPSPAEIDEAAGRPPLRLGYRSRQASFLGRSALRRLAGGSRTAAASGLVVGREVELSRLVGALPGPVLAEALREAGRELAACGLTTVADATPRSRAGMAPV